MRLICAAFRRTGSSRPQGSSVRQISVTAASGLTNQIAYQWFFYDHPIVGETNASLTIFNVNNFYLGTYMVQVSNDVETIMSSPAYLSLPFTVSIYTVVEVEFPTLAGRTYQLQVSSDMVAWTNVGAPIAGTGQPVQQLLSTRGSTAKFYKVMEQ